MENQNNSNQNCSCGEGCCPPQKKGNFWKRLLFIIIILAAGAIIAIKLVCKHDTPPEKCCNPAEKSACCPQSKTEE